MPSPAGTPAACHGWSSIQRRNGHLWVKSRNGHTRIADYKIGHGNGKLYVKYGNG